MVNKIKTIYPEINILNFRNGFFKSAVDEENLIKNITKLKPEFVFVAMGSPKQELLMEKISTYHKATYVGLGGSFDLFSGKSKRAPNWWLNNNLEWAYRLLTDFKRTKRQFTLFKFLIKLMLNKL